VDFQIGDILVSSQSSTTILLIDHDEYKYKYKVLMIRNGISSTELGYGAHELILLTKQPYNYKYCSVVK
jgi:hypothetical protein